MIDTSPKPLKTLTLNDIWEALTIIAKNQYRLRTEYNSYSRDYTYLPFTIKDKVINLGSYTIKDLKVNFKDLKDTTYSVYFLEIAPEIDYSEFYQRNYSTSSFKESNDNFNKALAKWQTNHSKNHKKEVNKVVEQFRRTKSANAAIRLLAILPELVFNDTRSFQKGWTYSRHAMKNSLEEETELQKQQEIKKSKERIKSLQEEAVREAQRLLRLEEELRNLKQA